MGLLTNKKLKALSGISFVAILIATAFIMAVSDEDYCITPYPIILNGPTSLPTTDSTATTIPISIEIPNVSDMPSPPSPAFPMDMTFIILIATGAVLLIIGRSKKN